MLVDWGTCAVRMARTGTGLRDWVGRPPRLWRKAGRGRRGTWLGNESLSLLTRTILEPTPYSVFLTGIQLAATRLLVALRAHELDHGQLPGALDELVPTCLDAVPLDPCDGQPLRYDRERRCVYSVGEDLQDAGGAQSTSEVEIDRDEPTFFLPE